MKLSEFLLRYVYTRKCPCCSELIDYDHAVMPFAPSADQGGIKPRWRRVVLAAEPCASAYV